MTLDELREAAQGEGGMVLVIPRRSKGVGIRMFGNRGPRGEILCEHPDRNETTAWFEKSDVRRWLAKQEPTK